MGNSAIPPIGCTVCQSSALSGRQYGHRQNRSVTALCAPDGDYGPSQSLDAEREGCHLLQDEFSSRHCCDPSELDEIRLMQPSPGELQWPPVTVSTLVRKRLLNNSVGEHLLRSAKYQPVFAKMH